MDISNKIQELRDRERIAKLGGGQDRIEKQHSLGKLETRERIERLLDPGSFLERGMFITYRRIDFGMGQEKFLGDGVVN